MYLHRKVILLAIACLTALFFIESFLHGKVPERVEVLDASINLTGLYILLSIYGVTYFAFRKILKDEPEAGFVFLVVLAIVIVLFSELLFQTYRVAMADEMMSVEDKLGSFLKGIIGVSMCSLIVAVPLAAKFKYNKKWLTFFLSIGLAILMYVIAVWLGYVEFKGFDVIFAN